MSLASALSAYSAVNGALAAGVIGLLALEAFRRRSSARKLLQLHYLIAAGVAASAPLAALLPPADVLAPGAKIWSAQHFESFNAPVTASGSAYLSFGAGAANLDAGSVSRVWIAAVLALLAFGIVRLAHDFHRLRAIRRDSHCVRRQGRVRIWLNDSLSAPFSCWLPRGAHVFVPSYVLERPGDFRMVVAHELQHHRQRDTVWLYFFRVLSWLCLLNPLAHLWTRRLGRVQEFACDEAVIAHRRWSVDEYARCLLAVAANSRRGTPAPHFATHLIRFGDPLVLTRRIEMMMQPKTWSPVRPLQLSMVVGLMALMIASAYAASGLVQDRRVTREQAETMAARIPASGGFTVVINDEVLHELNRYAGTPQGREFMRAALQRYEAQRVAVTEALARHGVPTALAAVPLIESGYQNLDQSHNRLSGAGIWQFIPVTARALGLRVDEQVDERLDPLKLSDAAGRMLRADHLRFADWQLALVAFNIGARGLQEGIDATGTRDPWALARAGYAGENYLARVHAAVLIAANPEAVKP
jgi:membrane-bound lytic murein transglycosylase D